ncbi:hypothetical protein S83_050626 [Arachis hypogaea]
MLILYPCPAYWACARKEDLMKGILVYAIRVMENKCTHALSIKLGFEGDIHLSNSTLDMCENRGHGYPQKVFANMNSA